jgi:hypothetical protein
MNSLVAAEKYYKSLEPEILETVKAIDAIILGTNEGLEGNCFYHGNTLNEDWFFLYKRMNYSYVIQEYKLKNILEIGFNAGHSAAVFLAAMDKDAMYTCFDLGQHAYTKPCFDYIQSKYPQVQRCIEGDSKETIKNTFNENVDLYESFDCVHIDGGHDDETVQSDIQYSHYFLKKGGILILDDTQMVQIFKYIPAILALGYAFIFQIPTFGFSHVCFQKL